MRRALPTALLHRRQALGRVAQAAGAGWLALSWRTVAAQAAQAAPPETAFGADLPTAIRLWTEGVALREGRITLELPPLVENGNGVPMTLRVQSPMTAADHVQAVAVFNELNPQRDVVRFSLGPRVGQVNGVVQIDTRVRLATSQKVVALARMSNGQVFAHTVEVVVTLAACAEG
jgi:sulfur-oxidizing protein SoxY